MRALHLLNIFGLRPYIAKEKLNPNFWTLFFVESVSVKVLWFEYQLVTRVSPLISSIQYQQLPDWWIYINLDAKLTIMLVNKPQHVSV